MRTRDISGDIAPDEIFLDASNLPGLDAARLEGRVERPVSSRTIQGVGFVFALIATVFAYRAYDIQVAHGDAYADISRANRLERTVAFAPRGVIYDRTHRKLAWNDMAAHDATATTTETETVDLEDTYARRQYLELPGLAHVLGFVQYPKAAQGQWWREEYQAVSGAELAFDTALAGENGSVLTETDALGNTQRTDIIVPPIRGEDVTLSIDAEVQNKLYAILAAHAAAQHFQGGAAVLMDVTNGEILALTSIPEYDHAAFASGDNAAIRKTYSDPRSPALDRAVAGAYTPGSIVKPMFAAAALEEHVIDPKKKILSTGALILPNPYDHTSYISNSYTSIFVLSRDNITTKSLFVNYFFSNHSFSCLTSSFGAKDGSFNIIFTALSIRIDCEPFTYITSP
jgi:penicillin-binding protein 2